MTLHANVVPSSGYREEDGSITIFPRQPTQQWREFKASEDAGVLRKLWSFSKEVCKSELEAMASGDAEKNKTKVSLAAAGTMVKECHAQERCRKAQSFRAAKGFSGVSAARSHV